MSSGPATRNRRGPIRPARLPTRVDRTAQQDPHRQPDHRGREGAVAERALDEDRVEAEEDVERAVDQEGRQVDDREPPVPEQLEGHERVGPARHQDREEGDRHDPDGQRDPGHRIRPGLLLAADQAERQAADGQDRRRSRRASRTARSRPPGPSRASPGGARRGPARTSGTLIRNASRQVRYWTRRPPTTGPRTVAAEVAAAQIPNARASPGPSKAAVMRASEPGTRMAAAAPWRSRKTTSASRVGARPHRALVVAKPTRPIAKTRFRP